MPKSPGWATTKSFNNTLFTGTTQLVMNVPSEVVDYDIMLMFLSHKGTDWAVVPAGWTLIQRGLATDLRGEVYWRRASSEPASYTVTGLATVASGTILAYSGGLRSGDPIIASSVESITDTNQDGALSITTDSAKALIVGFYAATSATSFAIKTTADGSFPFLAPVDTNIDYLNTRFTGGTTNSNITIADGIKVVPGATGQIVSDSSLSGARVSVLIALKEETSYSTTGTRYYFTPHAPKVYIAGPTQIDWDFSFNGPRNYINTAYHYDFCWELSQYKSGQGGRCSYDKITRGGGTASVAGDEGLWRKWYTPPLGAQEISGNLTLRIGVGSGWVEGNKAGTSTAKLRVHAYITQGNTTTPRAVLINDYTDANAWSNATWFEIREYVLAMTTQSALEGDRVAIEIGYYIVTAPTPDTTTFPASNYVATYFTRGCCSYRGYCRSPVGLPDAVIGGVNLYVNETDGRYASYLEFQNTLTEVTDFGTTPTNISSGTAEVIASLPYESAGADTREVGNTTRALYYSYTAPSNQRLIVTTFKTNYNARITMVSGGTYVDGGLDERGYLGRALGVYDVAQGATIIFRVEAYVNSISLDSTTAAAWGGLCKFNLYVESAPADGDIFLGTSNHVLRYRGATLVGARRFSSSVTISGMAIDYSLRPMASLNGGTVSDERLYAADYSSGTVEILDLATLNNGEAEIDYMYDCLTDFRPSSLTMTRDGMLYICYFGDGFQRIANSSASYMDRVSTAAAAPINKIDGTKADNQAGAPFTATAWEVTLGAGGVNYAEIDDTGATIFYTSGGWYVPLAGAQTIYKVNASTGAQLANFGTIDASAGPNPGLKGIFPLPSGGALVCNGNEIVRVNNSGTVMQTYTVPTAGINVSFADVEITADQQYFWVLEELSTSLFKFNITTGELLISNWIGDGFGSSTSIVLYRATEFAPPAGGIYVIVPGKRNDTLWTHLGNETSQDVKIPNPFIKTGLLGE